MFNFALTVLQRFQHQQSQLREREAYEKRRSPGSHLREMEYNAHYNYQEPQYTGSNAFSGGRVSNNPFYEYGMEHGGPPIRTMDQPDYTGNEYIRQYNEQHRIKNEIKSKHTNVQRSTINTEQNEQRPNEKPSKNRDDHGKYLLTNG